MKIKTLIISFGVGILISTIIFTLLITANMASIDYSVAESYHVFKILGQKYLEVVVRDYKPIQEVIFGPIAVTSMISSIIVYGCIRGWKIRRQR